MIPSSEIEPQIMTISGPVHISELATISVVLSHEHLFQNLSKKYSGEVINQSKI